MASSVLEMRLTKSVWTRSAKTKLQHQEPAVPPNTQIHQSVEFGGLTSNNALAEPGRIQRQAMLRQLIGHTMTFSEYFAH